jgi:hypothetical protein
MQVCGRFCASLDEQGEYAALAEVARCDFRCCPLAMPHARKENLFISAAAL